MKKLLLVVVVLMGFITNSYAGIYGKVEIGVPTNGSYYKDTTNKIVPINSQTPNNPNESIQFEQIIEDKEYSYQNTFFTNIVLGYKNNLFGIIDYKVFTGIFTWGNREGIKPNGFPFEDIYGIGTEIKYKGLYLQYNHFCAHPVISDTNFHNNYVPDSKSWMSHATSIIVGYEFEIN